MKKACFTGHRAIQNLSTVKHNLNILLERLIKDNVIDFYAGGALGFDYEKPPVM